MNGNVNCRYIDNFFTAEEIEAMTGVVPALQRTWKQRGFLGGEQHARGRLSVHVLVRIMALQIASQSIPVEMQFVHEAAAAAVPSILWYALYDPKAWDIDGSAEQKAQFKKFMASDNMEELPYLSGLVGLKADQCGRYIVLRGEGWQFVNDLDGAFEDVRTPAAVVLDLMAIAKKLVESPERPRGLYTVTDILIGKKASVMPPPRPPKK